MKDTTQALLGAGILGGLALVASRMDDTPPTAAGMTAAPWRAFPDRCQITAPSHRWPPCPGGCRCNGWAWSWTRGYYCTGCENDWG